MSSQFDINKIINPSVVNPLAELEAVSTDFITDKFFGNEQNRFNFYWIIQKLFDEYKEKILSNELAIYKPYVFLIFKGGNIIKAIIDKSEQNIKNTIIKIDETQYSDDLKTEYTLSEYNKTKRSDSDFTILINYPKIEQIITDNNQKILIYTKILVACEYISYSIQKKIRYIYNHKEGTIELGTYSLPITNLKENTNSLEELQKSYNDKFGDLVKRTIEILDKIKTDEKEESDIEFITNTKNIVVNLVNIFASNKIVFDKKQNYESKIIFKKVLMPQIKGFVINDYVQYNTNDITQENSISFNKLVSIASGKNINKNTGENNNTSNKDDMEIYYANDNNIPLIADDISLDDILNNKSNIYNGFSIGNMDINNDFLFNNYQKLSYNKLIRQKIIKTISKRIPNDNPLYISTNRTVRFIKNNRKTAFNLIRTKHNFRVFFELPYTIIKMQNEEVSIKYFYIDIPGEFIDITVSSYADDGILEYSNNFDKYITKREMIIKNPNNEQNMSQEIYTYSNYGLIHDIEGIIYRSTNNLPWTDNKYAKRLERLFRLYFSEIKNKLFINDEIKKQLIFIYESMSTIKKKYEDFKINEYTNFIEIVNHYIKIIYSELKIIDQYISKNQKKEYNLFNDLFNSILGPIKIFNTDAISNKLDEKMKEKIIVYLDDIIKYYKIFVDNITLPSQGNLYEIQLGGVYYKKYIKYKQKYLRLRSN